jgi:hypothetical protein
MNGTTHRVKGGAGDLDGVIRIGSIAAGNVGKKAPVDRADALKTVSATALTYAPLTNARPSIFSCAALAFPIAQS